jgi:hypothetical protein
MNLRGARVDQEGPPQQAHGSDEFTTLAFAHAKHIQSLEMVRAFFQDFFIYSLGFGDLTLPMQ